MKKIANKTICLLLTLVMLLGVMPLAGIGTFRAKAAEAAEAAATAAALSAAGTKAPIPTAAATRCSPWALAPAMAAAAAAAPPRQAQAHPR